MTDFPLAKDVLPELKMSSTAWKVALTLCYLMKCAESDTVKVSFTVLSEHAGLGIGSVQTGVSELRDYKFFEVKGHKSGNTYTRIRHELPPG